MVWTPRDGASRSTGFVRRPIHIAAFENGKTLAVYSERKNIFTQKIRSWVQQAWIGRCLKVWGNEGKCLGSQFPKDVQEIDPLMKFYFQNPLHTFFKLPWHPKIKVLPIKLPKKHKHYIHVTLKNAHTLIKEKFTKDSKRTPLKSTHLIIKQEIRMRKIGVLTVVKELGCWKGIARKRRSYVARGFNRDWNLEWFWCLQVRSAFGIENVW